MKVLKIEFQSSKNECRKPVRMACKEQKTSKEWKNWKTSMAQRGTGLQSVGKV